jgi:hypothetical protein
VEVGLKWVEVGLRLPEGVKPQPKDKRLKCKRNLFKGKRQGGGRVQTRTRSKAVDISM